MEKIKVERMKLSKMLEDDEEESKTDE